MTKEQKIRKLLKGKEYLINYACLHRHSYEEIKAIIKLPYWSDPKYSYLLTSSIWYCSSENIKEILELPYWSNLKYNHLLTPSLLAIKANYIKENMELYIKYNLDSFIVISSLRKNPYEQSLLLDFLYRKNVPLIVDMKLTPLLTCSNKVLKEKYDIDMEKLIGKLKSKVKTKQ